MLVLTYHQVMPAFLDFLFPFGRQQHAQDFHYASFRHEDRLTEREHCLHIPELGWSGRELRVCYNLTSVEPLKNSQWPWSLRQAAIYHSFDVGTGRANWIIVKGNQLMKKRIMSATKRSDPYELTSFGTTDRAYASTLATHLLICDWAGEHWRWYINFLEDSLQKSTRQTLSISADQPGNSVPDINLTRMLSPTPLLSRATFSTAYSEKTMAGHPMSSTAPNPTLPSEAPYIPSEPRISGSPPEFSFGDLQQVQFIEEKANEAFLVLSANSSVLRMLQQHYLSMMDSGTSLNALKEDCQEDVHRFGKRLAILVTDLSMEQTRLKTLLRLLGDRKDLVGRMHKYVAWRPWLMSTSCLDSCDIRIWKPANYFQEKLSCRRTTWNLSLETCMKSHGRRNRRLCR